MSSTCVYCLISWGKLPSLARCSEHTSKITDGMRHFCRRSSPSSCTHMLLLMKWNVLARSQCVFVETRQPCSTKFRHIRSLYCPFLTRRSALSESFISHISQRSSMRRWPSGYSHHLSHDLVAHTSTPDCPPLELLIVCYC